jgi:hypothetical protein
MTRHDLLVRTAALPRHRPPGSAAPSPSATFVVCTNPMEIVATGAQTRPGRRLPDTLTAPYAAGRDRHLNGPKQKYP